MCIATQSGRRLRSFIATFVRDDSGQDLIEYALLTGIIGVTTLLAFSSISTKMGNTYNNWNTAAQNVWVPCPPQPAACP